MALTPSQKEAKEWILQYLSMSTRRGCFFLLGEHLSGKTYLLNRLSQEFKSSVINLNLFLSKKIIEEPNYGELAKYNSPKIKELFRKYLKKLFESEIKKVKLKDKQDTIDLLLLDHLEILFEYDIDFAPLFEILSENKKIGERKKIIVAVPGRVSEGKMIVFNSLTFPQPEFYAEIRKEY